MKLLLILNSILLALSLGFGAFFLELFLRAEKKLAKHNESVIFKEKK